MNFTELYKKIAEMDGSALAPHDSTSAINGDEFKDEPIEECGGMMPMGMSHQQDSISANVSMNASGKGGIRDLMDILKNLDSGQASHGHDEMPSPDDLEVDIKSMDHPHDEPSHDEHGEEDGIIFGNDMEEEFSNEPDEMYAPYDAMVNPPSNDLNKPKQMYKHSYHQGDNAMAMESLKSNLENLYREVKSR